MKAWSTPAKPRRAWPDLYEPWLPPTGAVFDAAVTTAPTELPVTVDAVPAVVDDTALAVELDAVVVTV
jgi:hypothetical protein